MDEIPQFDVILKTDYHNMTFVLQSKLTRESKPLMVYVE